MDVDPIDALLHARHLLAHDALLSQLISPIRALERLSVRLDLPCEELLAVRVVELVQGVDVVGLDGGLARLILVLELLASSQVNLEAWSFFIRLPLHHNHVLWRD